jgi:regulator of replication initiation timing
MARHPEVKEKEIISAALKLAENGKTPNPGAIRVELGHKGGLVRIRQVWESYQAKNAGLTPTDSHIEFSFDDLPSDIADAATHLITQQKHHLETLVVNAFQRCQMMFEKRTDDLNEKHQKQILFYTDYEKNADLSIYKLESELLDLQSELKTLVQKNTQLLIDNSRLIGRLSVFEDTGVPTETATLTNQAKLTFQRD